MAGFWDAASANFRPGLELGVRQAQLNREMALREAADARAQEAHAAQMAEVLRRQNMQKTWDAGVANLVDARNLGVLDPRATAAAQATAGMQAMDYDSPSGAYDAAPAAPVARGQKMGRGDFSRGLSQLGLATGMVTPESAANMDDKAQAYDKDDRRIAFGKKYAGMSDAELLQQPELRRLLNDNPQIKGAVGYDEKTKKFIVTDWMGSGKAETFTRDELMDAAAQLFEEQEGDLSAASQRGVARADRQRNRSRQDMGDYNTGLKTAEELNQGRERNRIAQGHLGVAQEREARERSQLYNVTYGIEMGPDGQPRHVQRGMRLGKGGQVDSVSVPLPQGFVPLSAIDSRRIAENAEALVGKPIPGVRNPDGTPAVYTPAQASNEAYRAMVQGMLQPGQPPGGGLPDTGVRMPPRGGAGRPTPAGPPQGGSLEAARVAQLLAPTAATRAAGSGLPVSMPFFAPPEFGPR